MLRGICLPATGRDGSYWEFRAGGTGAGTVSPPKLGGAAAAVREGEACLRRAAAGWFQRRLFPDSQTPTGLKTNDSNPFS
jgi:hypothetical protein